MSRQLTFDLITRNTLTRADFFVSASNAQALAARRIQAPADRQDAGEGADERMLEAAQDEFIQAVPQHDPDDEDATQVAPHWPPPAPFPQDRPAARA